jgi:type IV pilus assembly protein PilV
MELTRTGGFALTEVLITIVLVAFGLLGLAGLMSRSFVAEVEATQRTQAMMLLHDMASRIEANRREAADYVTGDEIRGGQSLGHLRGEQNCAALATTPERDLCEWNNQLVGVADQVNAGAAGVLPRAVGCIHEIDEALRIYSITIAWQGVNEGVEPSQDEGFAPARCGKDLYGRNVNGDETHRRLLTLPVRLATLT